MVRYMADSVEGRNFTDLVAVPGFGVQPVPLFAGYVNGLYAASSHDTGRVNVEIDVDATHASADILDIEKGDATPDAAPGWVIAHNRTRTDYPAILYCNRSTITAVANALDAAGLVVVRDYRWFIATLDGTRSVADMTGVTAVQAYSANSFPNNIDLSVVYDDAWKAAVPVATVPAIPGVWKQLLNYIPRPNNNNWVLIGIGVDNNLWAVDYINDTHAWGTPFVIGAVHWG